MWDWLLGKKPERINRTWLWLALVAFIAMLTINALAATTTWLGGMSTGEVSDSYPNLFAPSGYTFSIWSLIYLLLIGFMVRSFGLWRTRAPRLPIRAHNKVLKLFAATSVLNVAWLLSWHYGVFWLSVILMAVLLLALAWMQTWLSAERHLSLFEAVATRAPFSVYFGWVTVALIANVTTWLVSFDWNGWGVAAVSWTVWILVLGAAIIASVGFYWRDWIYVAVGVWAYVGILVKHVSSTELAGEYMSIVTTLSVLIALLIATTCTLAVWTVADRNRLSERLAQMVRRRLGL